MSWAGIKVRHVDGSTGVIRSDYTGFLHRALTIVVDGSEREAFIQLNSDTKDTGDTGWSWYCPEFSNGPAWLPLGDHSGVELVLEAPIPRAAQQEPGS